MLCGNLLTIFHRQVRYNFAELLYIKLIFMILLPGELFQEWEQVTSYLLQHIRNNEWDTKKNTDKNTEIAVVCRFH